MINQALVGSGFVDNVIEVMNSGTVSCAIHDNGQGCMYMSSLNTG